MALPHAEEVTTTVAAARQARTDLRPWTAHQGATAHHPMAATARQADTEDAVEEEADAEDTAAETVDTTVRCRARDLARPGAAAQGRTRRGLLAGRHRPDDVEATATGDAIPPIGAAAAEEDGAPVIPVTAGVVAGRLCQTAGVAASMGPLSIEQRLGAQ